MGVTGLKYLLAFAVAAALVTSSAGQCNSGYYADGDCDRTNNNAECGYDGGDCCECTCVSGSRYSCEDSDFACIDPDAACVDDDDVTAETASCIATFLGDAYCDEVNNNAACDYDGGDCCECTCSSTELVSCGSTRDFGGGRFSCIDPSAPCVAEEDADTPSSGEEEGEPVQEEEEEQEEQEEEEVDDDDGAVPFDEDQEEVAPTAKPTSPPSSDSTTSSESADDSTTSSPTSDSVDEPVEVGTKTGVSIAATAYDMRAGRSSDDVIGCGDEGGDGCAAYLAHDGDYTEVESRWSCAGKIVPDGGVCEIEFVFDEPQDIVDIEVAFWKGNERTRTLEVKLNGEHTHTHESYAGATFNTLGVEADSVYTVALEAVHLDSDDWISLIEVMIMVKP